MKLSDDVIKKRMRKLYNYENKLHPELKERNKKLRSENKRLKEEIEELKKANVQVQKLELELEEMRKMALSLKPRGKKGKNKGKNKNVTLPAKDSNKGEKPKKERNAESYRKKEPSEDEVTSVERHSLDDGCPDCGSNDITKKKEHISYIVDLQNLNILIKNAKTVVKKIIESGYCNSCGKRKSAAKIPKQKVSIGQNTKQTVVYLHIVLGLSYSEVITHLKSRYNMDISQGQITNSLSEQANLLKPYYQYIFNSLQEEVGCHYDETSWNTQGTNGDEGEGNYTWVKIGNYNNNVIYWFGRSRGKNVAEKLRGSLNFKHYDGSEEEIKEKISLIANQVGISDDYGSYRNLFENHQLCWAHPFRKIRDLAQSGVLDPPTSKHCIKTYEQFAKLYKKVQKARDKFNDGKYKADKDRKKDVEKLMLEFDKFVVSHKKDPEKLIKIKGSLKDRKDRYFTCLRIKGIPLDNNKAERAIRKVVLKRKKSLGCKSQKGANTLSILYSTVFSIIGSSNPEEFFEKYNEALRFGEQ